MKYATKQTNIIKLPYKLLLEETGAVFGTGKKENKSKDFMTLYFNGSYYFVCY